MTPELARVIALAKRRGACVRVVDRATWDQAGGHNDWREAPFSHISLAIDERDPRELVSLGTRVSRYPPTPLHSRSARSAPTPACSQACRAGILAHVSH